jgi:hypothetical protein
MQKEIFLLSFPQERLCRKSSSRPSPPVDASRDPDNVPAKAGNQTPNDVIGLFTGFRISPREAVFVRNDGFGELQHSLERGNPERVIPRKKSNPLKKWVRS